MIRWKYKYLDGKEIVGEWGESTFEGQAGMYTKDGLEYASVEYKQGSVIRELFQVKASEFKRFAWISVAKQFSACEHNIGMAVEAETYEYIVDTKSGNFSKKELT